MWASGPTKPPGWTVGGQFASSLRAAPRTDSSFRTRTRWSPLHSRKLHIAQTTRLLRGQPSWSWSRRWDSTVVQPSAHSALGTAGQGWGPVLRGKLRLRNPPTSPGPHQQWGAAPANLVKSRQPAFDTGGSETAQSGNSPQPQSPQTASKAQLWGSSGILPPQSATRRFPKQAVSREGAH